MIQQSSLRRIFELTVLFLVVSSTAILSFDYSSDESVEMEVAHISGTIELATRSSMDAVGLQEYSPGALMSLDLNVQSVVSTNCEDCQSAPEGVRLNGTIFITEITGGVGGMGRVEAEVEITHLQEFISEDMVYREWLSVYWKAGGEVIDLQILQIHEPPRWTPAGYSASLLSTDRGMETRTGPWILVETLSENLTRVQGCLPQSHTCNHASSPHIDLQSTLVEVRKPLKVEQESTWFSVNHSVNGTDEPERFSTLRQALGLEEDAPVRNLMCAPELGTVESMKTWRIEGDGGISISPVLSLFEGMGLRGMSLEVQEGVWTEIESSNGTCANIITDDGELRTIINLNLNN